MDINTIPIDRDMAHVILSAFTVASFEGMSSLNAKPAKSNNKPNNSDFVHAEANVLRTLNTIYPDVVAQYFDVKQCVNSWKT
jgi:hypothetical protein